jgi:hypothetical protein
VINNNTQRKKWNRKNLKYKEELKQYRQRKQWNRKNLKNKEELKQYRQSLHNKLEIVKKCQDVNTEW